MDNIIEMLCIKGSYFSQTKHFWLQSWRDFGGSRIRGKRSCTIVMFLWYTAILLLHNNSVTNFCADKFAIIDSTNVQAGPQVAKPLTGAFWPFFWAINDVKKSIVSILISVASWCLHLDVVFDSWPATNFQITTFIHADISCSVMKHKIVSVVV